MKQKNNMSVKFLSLPQNEGFARTVIAAFCLSINPSVEELCDIKTAVSEAVTNCVVHAYEGKIGEIELSATLDDNTLYIEVADNGKGIDDINKAREPFFTTKPHEERSGMGFTVMESFMDKLSVIKNKHGGIIVKMTKELGKSTAAEDAAQEQSNAFAQRNN